MAKKKILIIYSGYLFPLIMASQHRVFDMLKTLSLYHEVHFMSFVKNKKDKQDTTDKIIKICKKYIPIIPINYESSFIKKKIIGLKAFLSFAFMRNSLRQFYVSNDFILDQLISYLNSYDFDIIQIEYWYNYKLFKKLPKKAYKVIDSHGILFKKKEKEYNKLFNMKTSFLKIRELNQYRLSEINAIKDSDLFISISELDDRFINQNFKKLNSIIIHTGQNLKLFEDYNIEQFGDTILFYGGMDSKQNYFAVIRFIEKILPHVKKQIPEVKVRIVGQKPPSSIKNMHNGYDFFVEGFVPDVRDPISKCCVMVLPLELGAGFRSRIVEVMALGVPIVGTHNALDNAGLTSGKDAYISDGNEKMANYLIELLNDSEKRNLMSKNCKEFVSKNFSLEKTYGKLSKHYSSLK